MLDRLPRPELSSAIEWLWFGMKMKSNHASKPDSGKAARRPAGAL